tara:strand:- start:554 stop:817 length:264 start_codon:yes stop_codon:yes gene_type:complete
LRKELLFILKIFWPHRPDSKGFSIESLARKYRQKISSSSPNKSSNQLFDDRNLKPNKGSITHIAFSHESIKKGHWANRDFSEYREVA